MLYYNNNANLEGGMVFERPDIVLNRPSATWAAKHYKGLFSDGGNKTNRI